MLLTINITLMVVLIVQLGQQRLWMALTLGAVALAISLFGISFYSFLTIKEIQLNRRQSNFVDSVTHELKTPIAALRLYLDTLIMCEPAPEDRHEFYQTMNSSLTRLDRLINQLLEVGRLDAIGHEGDAETIPLADLLRSCAETVCLHHKVEVDDVFQFEVASVCLKCRRMLLEMIFGNLLDNAVKYGGNPPQVAVHAFPRGNDRIVVRIRDNGPGVPQENRRRIFQLFFRGNDELQRTKTGTGLGLYIVRTLVGMLKGRIVVTDSETGVGSVFEVTLPGRVLQSTESVAGGSLSQQRSRVSGLALAAFDAMRRRKV